MILLDTNLLARMTDSARSRIFMVRTLTAVVHKDGNLFVADCLEVGTVSQGATIKEAIGNLKEATELYLEEFPVEQMQHPLVTTFEVVADA